MFIKLCVIWCFISVTLNNSTFSQQSVGKTKKITIVIDPGHGGKDQGAQGLHSTEAAICLSISRKLGQEIKSRLGNVKVLYTRTTNVVPGNFSDINDGLRYRADFANRSSADLFISLHCNSAGKQPGGWSEKRIARYKKRIIRKGRRRIVLKTPVYKLVYVENQTRGTESYVWAAKENEQKAEVIGTQNEFENRFYKNIKEPETDPVINALKLIYTQKYFVKSLKVAEMVQRGFQQEGRINRGVKQRNEKGIWVLHATGMPGVLIETGFITNKKEEQYLLSNQGQKAIAHTICSALKQYFNLPLMQSKKGRKISKR